MKHNFRRAPLRRLTRPGQLRPYHLCVINRQEHSLYQHKKRTTSSAIISGCYRHPMQKRCSSGGNNYKRGNVPPAVLADVFRSRSSSALKRFLSSTRVSYPLQMSSRRQQNGVSVYNLQAFPLVDDWTTQQVGEPRYTPKAARALTERVHTSLLLGSRCRAATLHLHGVGKKGP